MLPRPLPYREVKRKLAAGFTEVSQRGSHVKFVKQTLTGQVVAVVPKHWEVATGTLRTVLRQAILAWDEFEQL